MRTLVISDLHLGNQQGYDVFAGEQSLPALLDRFTGAPTRVVVNGDMLDFLMNEDPLELRVERAVQQARALVEAGPTRAVLHALGRILAADGEVIVRVGNHDIELALPQVQAVVTEALGQKPAIALRMAFRIDDDVELMQVGGARLLLEHGDRVDTWNRVDHRRLARSLRTRDFSEFAYPPGSQLVKTVLNPLRRLHEMRFTDLLKPDFQGAALTALAVDAIAVKELLEENGMSLAWQLFRNSGDGPMFFAAGDDEAPTEPELGLADAVDDAGLLEEERAALEELLGDQPLFFASEDEATTGRRRRALLKLGRAGLGSVSRRFRGGSAASPDGDSRQQAGGLTQELIAQAQQAASRRRGVDLLSLEPTEAEWARSRELAAAHGASAVLRGHTHAARFGRADDVVTVNTGTWADLLSVPQVEADASVWDRFLDMLKRNPALDPARGEAPEVLRRFTASLIQPTADGAMIQLVELDARGQLETLGEAPLPAAG